MNEAIVRIVHLSQGKVVGNLNFVPDEQPRLAFRPHVGVVSSIPENDRLTELNEASSHRLSDGANELPFRERLGDDVLRPDESVSDQETRDRVLAAVPRLPDLLRSVVMLVHFHELKYAEAAKVLHIPIGTVKSRLYQARRSLRHSSIRSNES